MIDLPKKEPLNLVPFIDIMLVLLAMVLSVSTFIAKGEIAVSLPESENAAAPSQADDTPLLLHVGAAGTVFWEAEQVALETVKSRLEALPRDNRIVLRIDKDARFDRFIAVIDLLKKYNHENFAIATEKVDSRS